MIDFREALDNCMLEDLGFSCSQYTWERGKTEANNVRERIDKVVQQGDGVNCFQVVLSSTHHVSFQITVRL